MSSSWPGSEADEPPIFPALKSSILGKERKGSEVGEIARGNRRAWNLEGSLKKEIWTTV